MVGASSIADDLAIGSGVTLFAIVLAGPTALAWLLEPWIHALSDRLERRRLRELGLAGCALCLALAAWAENPLFVALAIAGWGLATGVSCGVAQSLLVVGVEPDRAMTRWALATAVGDVLAPLLVGATTVIGIAWRGALLVAAGVSILALILLRFARPVEDVSQATSHLINSRREVSDFGGAKSGSPKRTSPAPTTPAGLEKVELRAVLRDRNLLAWLCAMASCTLLDEIIIVIAALRLGSDTVELTVQLTVLLGSTAFGLSVLSRYLRRYSTNRILIASSALVVVSLLVWWWFPDGPLAWVALAVLGAAESVHWPLAKSQAFQRLPDRPGLVNALESVFNLADVAFPLAIGAIVTLFGIHAATLVLLIEPLIVAWIAAVVQPTP